MKKKLMAVGVTAALGAMSGVSSAAMIENTNGVGHINILPYYSVNSGNVTLMSITNTDTVRGKAVKVRFRGAKFSDDVFDFQVFMSPADVWTAAVSLNGNVASLATSDKTCTLPASVNQNFVSARLLDADKATGTLEGYVEIINMGDIVGDGTASTTTYLTDVDGSTTYTGAATAAGVATFGAGVYTSDATAQRTLFHAIKHRTTGTNAGTAPCTSATLAGTTGTPVDHTNSLRPPTSGLTSFATIINVAQSKAFTFPATALSPDVALTFPLYARQANLTTGTNAFPAPINAFADDAGNARRTGTYTNDRIFDTATGTTTALLGGNVTMYEFDLPDLSTPYGHASTTAQLTAILNVLGKERVQTEFATDPAINAATDVLLSQPTRRYYYTWNDTPNAAAGDTQLTLATVAGATQIYSGMSAANNTVTVGAPSVFDREERPAANPTSIVISPNPATSASFTIKTEVAVVALNSAFATSGQTSALAAKLGAQNYDFFYTAGGTQKILDGWVTLSTTNQDATAQTFNGGRLPIIGFSAVNVFNSGVGSSGTNYGQVLPLKGFTRGVANLVQ